MTFDEFLISKNIDPESYKSVEKDQYALFSQEFNQMSPSSFNAQKLFLINQIRRMHHIDVARREEYRSK